MSLRRAALALVLTAGASLALGLGLSAAAEDDGVGTVPASPAPTVTYQGTTAAEDQRTTDDGLGCTGLDEPANFTVYSLGPEFDGLPVTAVIRRCDAPYPGESVRANEVLYIYGDCVIGPGEDGCAAPLAVQTWPTCERSLADYEVEKGVPYPHTELGQLRGVPAFSFDGGSRLEVYTGSSTVVLSGMGGEKQLIAAVDSLRAEPSDRPPGPPAVSDAKASSEADLPEPEPGAVEGQSVCTG